MDSAWAVGGGFTEKVTGELGLEGGVGVYQMEKDRKKNIMD